MKDEILYLPSGDPYYIPGDGYIFYCKRCTDVLEGLPEDEWRDLINQGHCSHCEHILNKND